MKKIVSAQLVNEEKVKDKTGQVKTTKTYTTIVGNLGSVYQREFYEANQNGLRPEGIIETCAFDYNGQRMILINNQEFTIYRTFQKGTDRIELFYGERVGNG